jgi:hypothetical protein
VSRPGEPGAGPGPGLRGLGVAVVCVLGQVLGVVPGLTTDRGFDVATWLYVPVPVAVVATLVLFGRVVPRADSRVALALALLGLASLLLFRLGVTLPLAGAAMVVARDVPTREVGRDRQALGVLVLSWITMGLFAVLVLGDAFA